MFDVFLLLGSNMGDRLSFLSKAVEYIESAIAPVVAKSSVYETQAWGKTDEADYLNQVVELKTIIPAETLLAKILTIENLLGRKRVKKWGARTIDIDILFYGQAIINEENLQIPHPELHKRRFTLEPLAEIVPQLLHPVLNKTIMQLKNELNDNLIVKKI